MSKATVLVELGGADPLHLATDNDSAVSFVIVDWDEIRAGEYATDQLLLFAELVEDFSPNTAADLRDKAKEQNDE